MIEIKPLTDEEIESKTINGVHGLSAKHIGFVEGAEFSKKRSDAYWLQQLEIEVRKAIDCFVERPDETWIEGRERYIKELKAKYNIQ